MTFSPRILRADLVAGLTVLLVGLPQCLAYAIMSGLPPAYGLSTAAVAGFVAAIAGKSPHVVTGPTNTTGLLILAALSPWLGANGLLQESGLAILASLTLLAGVLRIAAALLGGSYLIRFIPESVLAGFTAGAGILIAAMQLDEALGLSAVQGTNLWTQASQIVTTSDSVHFAAVALALGTVGAIAIGQRRFPRLPIPLVAVAGAAMIAPFIRDAGVALPVVSDVAAVPSGWPKGALPSLDPSVYANLALPAFAIVLLGTLELTVSARRGGAQPNLGREIHAQGLANVAGAFFASFPASASLTRSALLELGGAKTRVAAAAAALFVVPVVFFGGTFVSAIPQSSLAGVLLITGYGMVNRRRMKRIWQTSRASRLLLSITFVATLTLPFVWAILLGVGLGIVIHLALSSEPRLTLLRPEGATLVPVTRGESAQCVVVEVSGDFYFAAVRGLATRLTALLPHDATHIVLDMTHAHEARFAAVEALEQLNRMMEAEGRVLGLAGVSPRFQAIIERVGLSIPFTAYDPVPGRAALSCVARIGGPCATAQSAKGA